MRVIEGRVHSIIDITTECEAYDQQRHRLLLCEIESGSRAFPRPKQSVESENKEGTDEEVAIQQTSSLNTR